VKPAAPPPPPESIAFARLFPARFREIRGPVNIVSFLNLAFLLVLLYLARAPFVLQPGIRIELPSSEFTDGLPFDAMVVTVSQEGLVFFRDQRITLEGLEDAFRREVRERGDPRLIVEADGRVPHRTLVEIYAIAARAGLREVLQATRLPAPPPSPASEEMPR
jgi:biopolymer transport protein ExbD